MVLGKDCYVIGRGTNHDREDALLHLAGVLCSENDHFHAFEIDLDRGRRAHAFGESVGRELTGVIDDEIRLAKFC